MSEAEIQKQILEHLEAHELIGIVWQSDGGLRRSRITRSRFKKDLPDIGGILTNGRPFFFEVKTQKGRPTEGQLMFISRAEDLGALCGVVRSISDVEALLKFADEPG